VSKKTYGSQLALAAEEKLRRVTQWLGDLKRAIDSLNQAVDNYQDENSVRQEVTDVFEPMLQMLTDTIKFQHTWITGALLPPSYSCRSL
jgi:hypothetical protein